MKIMHLNRPEYLTRHITNKSYNVIMSRTLAHHHNHRISQATGKTTLYWVDVGLKNQSH